MLAEHYPSTFQPQYVDGLLNPSHRTLSFTTNPTNLDEVCVQATHIESKGKSAHANFFSAETSQSKEGRAKGKGKHTTTVRKGDERHTCSHCQREGHDKEHC